MRCSTWRRVRQHITKEPSGCWVWTGYRNPKTGYGQVSVNADEREELGLRSRTVTAPVLVCSIYHGPRPDGLEVLHLCHRRECCAPWHLRWGTRKENARMAWDEGNQQSGERHHRAKYSDALVAEARYRLSLGEPQRSIARELGMEPSYLSHLKAGRVRRSVA